MKEYAIYSKDTGACLGGIGVFEDDGWTEEEINSFATAQYGFDPDKEYITTRVYF